MRDEALLLQLHEKYHSLKLWNGESKQLIIIKSVDINGVSKYRFIRNDFSGFR